jgi:hypothetical protein
VSAYAVKLSWQPPSDVLETDKLRYHVAWWPSKRWGETRRTTYWVDGLLPGRKYRFLVTTLNGEHILASAVVSATTLPLPTPSPPPAPPPPTPTPLPEDVVLLSLMSHHSYVDALGDLQVVGEVRNDLGITVEAVKIGVTFYDWLDEPIAAQAEEALMPVIAPGERVPFRTSLSPAGDVAAYSLRVTGYATDQSPPLGPLVLASRGEQDEAGLYHVTGQVVNPTGQAVVGARAVVTLYDQWGQVVNAGTAYVSPFQLEPGEEGSFDCVFEHYPGVASYAVRATSY